ncbi:SIR2 family NAD-dependent protein deacylase [Cognatilysobacter terrigena]|uniref:SIR2 family NAD-dependent protein deacylase n=1 Tax=Cognatilysobacter terrigena TaxID=2488749 RepID=UPI001060B317|nr:NAD-dependent deacylase [Lysobacter terrigena]
MRLVVLTGAGMSAESGVPTFRDALTGLWARFDPERLATPEAFRRDPDLVWGWYRWRAAQVQRVQPNAGHAAIAAMERDGIEVDVVTQNVDDLHERAGSTRVHHLHGHLLQSRCIDCGATAEPDPIVAPYEGGDEGRHEAPPRCARCSGLFRPGVVWFGEALPDDAWSAGISALERADGVVVVGTSGLVHPAASLPGLARWRGLHVLEINPQTSALTHDVDEHWAMTASAGLTRLAEELRSA